MDRPKTRTIFSLFRRLVESDSPDLLIGIESVFSDVTGSLELSPFSFEVGGSSQRFSLSVLKQELQEAKSKDLKTENFADGGLESVPDFLYEGQK